jgi:hypothetical protein
MEHPILRLRLVQSEIPRSGDRVDIHLTLRLEHRSAHESKILQTLATAIVGDPLTITREGS